MPRPRSDIQGMVVALVPARAGSERIRNKNIRRLAGVPLVGWSILQAKQCVLIDEVYLSTDSPVIADIGREYGALVPFLRPTELAGPKSLDIEFFRHFMAWWKGMNGVLPELIVQLRPTCPLRQPSEVDEAIETMLDNPNADSLRSVSVARETPYKMWTFGTEAQLMPIMRFDSTKDWYDQPGQDLPKVWVQDGVVDIVRPRTVFNQDSLAGRTILGHQTKSPVIDIDVPEDLRRAKRSLVAANVPLEARIGILQGRLVPSETGNLQCFPTRSWEQELGIANALRFAHIEWLLPRTRYLDNPILDTAGLGRIQTIIDDSDVRIAMVCIDPILDVPIWSRDAEHLIERVLIAAGQLAASGIVLPLLEASTPDRHVAETKATLARLSALAAAVGVRIFVEITCLPQVAGQLLDTLPPEAVALCLDTGNLTRSSINPFDWYNHLATRIGHIHLKNVDAQGRNVTFSKGVFDVETFVRALEEAGYSGCFSLETDRGVDPIETARYHRHVVLSAGHGCSVSTRWTSHSRGSPTSAPQ